MKKKIVLFLLLFSLVSMAFPGEVSMALMYHSEILNENHIESVLPTISKQSFNSSLTVDKAKDYIRHFIENLDTYEVVPNGGGYSNVGRDAKYTVSVYPSQGCYHYAEFIATVMYGDYNGSLRIYPDEKVGKISPSGLKLFLQRYAQAGEHMRIEGYPHSLTFIGTTDEGLYTLQYTNTNGTYLSYSSFEHFAENILNHNSTQEFYIYNSDTAVNMTTNPDPNPDPNPGTGTDIAPINFKVESAGDNRAIVSWDPVPGAKFYEVQYWSPEGGLWWNDFDYKKHQDSLATSYITTGLSLDSYEYRVRAVLVDGYSTWAEFLYYTQQSPDPSRYTITFDSTGGSAVEDITLDYGANVSAPIDPIREGYIFDDWDKELPETMPAENMTLTARWKVNGYWKQIDGKWYYLDAYEEKVTGWHKYQNNWYYMDSSGVMQTGWLQLDGKWYYLSASGAMKTRWTKVGSTWYYMNSSGVMQTGWVKSGSTWYYLSASGAMRTGWAKLAGTWYYMNSSGAMQTGWLQLGTKWYYLDSSGAMQTGEVTISGKIYYFDSNGVWIKQ